MVGRRRILPCVLAVHVAACAAEAEPTDVGTTSSTEHTSTTGPGATTASSSTTGTSEDPSLGSSSTAIDLGVAEGSTSSGSDDGFPACDPVVPGEFNRCWNGTSYDGTLCNWTGTSESVGFVSCLMAAGVEDGSVCMVVGCVDRCDCFAPPTTGTAKVECMENIIADDTACVLYCGDGQQCPDGMVCGFNICVWEPR